MRYVGIAPFRAAATTLLILGLLAVGDPPAGAQVSTARTAYVANQTNPGEVVPIAVATNTAGTPITVNLLPRGIAITPDGATAWVTSPNMATVTPINTATNTAGAPVGAGNNASEIAITPDGATAYVTSPNGFVTPVDLATNTAGTAIVTGGAVPLGIAITPDGSTAYVAHQNSGNVIPIDLATNTAGTPIPIPGGGVPTAIAITPDGSTAYVTNFVNVTPIDLATNTAGTSITIGTNPAGIAITPDGSTAYVTNRGSGSVSPIDLATNTAGTPIVVGGAPHAIAITPDGSTAYVGDVSGTTVTPIDLATNTAGTPIVVGSGDPFAIAITPNQGPTAAFTAPTSRAGQATAFNAGGSSDTDGSVASYSWDFGDGQAATMNSAATSHTYAVPGSYTVSLTVTDNEGCSRTQVFTGQTVSCNGTSAARVTQQVTVAPPPTLHGLIVEREGDGAGTVTSSPIGIDCGSDCSQSYEEGTKVTLTESHPLGTEFAGWSGDCAGMAETCMVTMSQARNVAATFDEITAPGAHRRKISLRLRGHLIARGRVRSPDGPSDCISGAPVEIQRRIDREWERIRRATTADDGRFRKRLKDESGVYRARVLKTFNDDGSSCRKARSGRERHRHPG